VPEGAQSNSLPVGCDAQCAPGLPTPLYPHSSLSPLLYPHYHHLDQATLISSEQLLWLSKEFIYLLPLKLGINNMRYFYHLTLENGILIATQGKSLVAKIGLGTTLI
jgi:hypothetical protein